ncbi:MAG: MIP/aquaporin family protein [Pseudomonadota bacterium]
MTVFIAELVGSMFLLVFGFGGIASAQLNKSYGRDGGWLMSGLCWGIGLGLGILAAATIGSQGHVNPAITVAFIVGGLLPLGEALPYFAGQIVGGILSGLFVWLLYLPHWQATEDKDVKLTCFAMVPAIRNTPQNFVSEFLSFFIFVVGVFAIGAAIFPISPVASALATGLWLTACICATGGQTACGYGIDLGTRIAHQILPIADKRDSDWGYAWVPVAAPVVAAFVAAVLSRSLGFV